MNWLNRMAKDREDTGTVRPLAVDAGTVLASTDRLAFYPCSREDGDATFSVLYADPAQPWGFTSTPFEDDEEWWGDD